MKFLIRLLVFKVDHLSRFIHFRFSMGVLDSIIAKCKQIWTTTVDGSRIQNKLLKLPWITLYLINCFNARFCSCCEQFIFFDSPDIAMAVGYLVISRPFLDLTNQRHVNSTYSERLEVSMNENSLIRLKYFI